MAKEQTDNLTPDEFVDGLTPTGTAAEPAPPEPGPRIIEPPPEPIAMERLMGGFTDGERSQLGIWLAVAQTSKQFTKPISGRGYRGTDINPTYRAMQMTKVFGPYGKGWGIESCEFNTLALPPGEKGEMNVALHCTMRQWYIDPETKQKCIIGPHTGGEWLVRNGKYDEEAYKKVQTDAMTAGWRFLGISSDVYMALYDDSKYQSQLNVDETKRKVQRSGSAQPASPKGQDMAKPATSAPDAPAKESVDAAMRGEDPMNAVMEALVKEWTDYESMLMNRGMVEDTERHNTVRAVKQRFRDEISRLHPAADDLTRAELTLKKLREFKASQQ